MSRSCGSALSGMLVSSRYSVMRPTSSFQTWMQHAAGGQIHGDLQLVRHPASLHGLQRQRIEIVRRIAFLLPAVGIQILAEIALLIEQPHADQRIDPGRWRTSDDRRRECPGRRNRRAGTR